MKRKHLEELQEKLEQKAIKNKKTKMLISGKSVFSLNKIINKKLDNK